MIPKIIWQTHEWDYSDLPEIYKKTTTTWQKLNPNWTYNYLNAEERRMMVKKIKPSLLDYYDSYTGHTYNGKNIGGMLQCDLWRVVCLYEHGGVYADLDSICLGSLDEMADMYRDKDMVISSHFITKSEYEMLNDSLMGIPYNFQVNSGAGFAAKRHSLILEKMLNVIEGNDKTIDNSGNLWEIFSKICMNADIKLISYDFRWALHSGAFKP